MNMLIANPQLGNDYFPPAVKGALTPRQRYHQGYQAYCNLEDISVCVTEDELRGYLQALRDCADIETDIYLAKQQVRQ